MNVDIEYTFEFEKLYEHELDYRNKILPNNFQSNTERWQPRYTQVFEDKLGFQPNLSILDLLFCEGPNAANKLKTVN